MTSIRLSLPSPLSSPLRHALLLQALFERLSVVLTGEEDKASRMPDMAHHVVAAAEQALGPLPAESRTRLENTVVTLRRQEHPVAALLRRRTFDELRRHFEAERPEEVVCKGNTGLDVVADRLHAVCLRAVRARREKRQKNVTTGRF